MYVSDIPRNETGPIERAIFKAIQAHEGKRLKFPSRPGKKWDYNDAEWVYASYTLLEYNLDGFVKRYKSNMVQKNKYEAKIVYFV